MSLIERTSASRMSIGHSLWTGISAFMRAARRFTKNRLALQRMAEMDDALLKDIGLSRHEIHRAHMAPLSEDPMAELRKAAANRAARMYV
ncbi:MAG: hypothetical protein CMH13_10615 [Martelella sp.]|uniref:DUF1127 domain-containing protein n=1 Tax=unclassified Martelella TaxID=2629616 RepID=UPI000C40F499|nr:DUF1127 domain-containing protein [Martelella sp.]MAU20971.1 hypothetical protein [Martelella sp.]|tara:strand:- start:441 stop:710 length:270 start_codon:yes stop_codon:yes gene_type:complete